MKVLRPLGLRIGSKLVRTGHLTLVFPDDARHVLGPGDGPSACVEIKRMRGIWRATRSGVLGFAAAYIAEDLDTPDLPGLLEWGAANHNAWTPRERGFHARERVRRAWQKFGPRRPRTAVESMVDHYDMGNDFYAPWLDESMTYSSALFSGPGQSLEEAQEAKYRAIAELAGLQPGMRVLEIGCGWGGFAAYAAKHYQCRVVGLTISSEQAAFARHKMEAAGLTGLVEIRLQDFRETAGQFDRIVSIEMIESIDEQVWPALFQSVRRLLVPTGRAVLQAITIDNDHFGRYRNGQDFIQRYIFPGGQLPSPDVLRQLTQRAGLDWVTAYEFGLDYARTLALWRERFEDAWPILAPLGFDEPFRRLWRLYLAYCEAGFRSGRINVCQLAVDSPGEKRNLATRTATHPLGKPGRRSSPAGYAH